MRRTCTIRVGLCPSVSRCPARIEPARRRPGADRVLTRIQRRHARRGGGPRAPFRAGRPGAAAGRPHARSAVLRRVPSPAGMPSLMSLAVLPPSWAARGLPSRTPVGPRAPRRPTVAGARTGACTGSRPRRRPWRGAVEISRGYLRGYVRRYLRLRRYLRTPEISPEISP